MSWEIEYTDRWSGKKEVHVNTHNESAAIGWTKSLASDNDCKAVCRHIADGPYDRSGKVTHIVSYGNDK
jgi:hypothetical protein